MQPLEVSADLFSYELLLNLLLLFVLQVEFHMIMPSLVLVLDPSTWTMLLVLQVLASFWSALADQ